MDARNIVIGWLRACSGQHRNRLAHRLGMGECGAAQISTQGGSLDALAAGLLAECAGDLDLRPEELASIVGDPRRVGREAVLELALAGIRSSSGR